MLVTTTNENVDALRFYRQWGFAVASYDLGGFSEVLRLKGLDPTEAVTGQYGITIRDTLQLALIIAA